MICLDGAAAKGVCDWDQARAGVGGAQMRPSICSMGSVAWVRLAKDEACWLMRTAETRASKASSELSTLSRIFAEKSAKGGFRR